MKEEMTAYNPITLNISVYFLWKRILIEGLLSKGNQKSSLWNLDEKKKKSPIFVMGQSSGHKIHIDDFKAVEFCHKFTSECLSFLT